MGEPECRCCDGGCTDTIMDADEEFALLRRLVVDDKTLEVSVVVDSWFVLLPAKCCC